MNKITWLTCIFLSLNTIAMGQEKEGWIAYERGFEFKKGIYLTFEDFKMNSPGIEGELEKRGGALFVYNDSLKRKVAFRRNHWGYSNGQNIYISTYGGYTRIGIIGELSFFGIVTGTGANTAVGVSSVGGVGIGIGTPSSSTSEYLLDFNTGSFIPFTRKNFEKILEARDPLLFQQYKEHKGKKKEKVHLFLSAYNDKNPIYFPE